MKRITKLLSAFLMITNLFVYAQTNNSDILKNGTIDEQFEYVLNKSSNYRNYKVVRTSLLNTLKSHVNDSIKKAKNSCLVSNLVHCRYEVTDEGSMDTILKLINDNCIDMLSFMDHSPGQGQFKSMDAYGNYLKKNYKKSSEEVDEIIKLKLAGKEKANLRITQLAECAKKQSIAIASHDDDTVEKVKLISKLGVQISEFPINIESAKFAKECGMTTVFGAPNIIRGGSQSGAVKAMDAINAQVATCLCSDYTPGAMLPSVFIVAKEIGLNNAVNMVTAEPAKAANLNNLGSIKIGKQADLIAVSNKFEISATTAMWKNGNIAWSSDKLLNES